MTSQTAAMHHDVLHSNSPMRISQSSPTHQSPEVSIKPELSSPELEQPPRGRRRSRDHDEGDGRDQADGSSGDGEGEGDGPSRKRRRSRKGLDKKFDCPHEKCGKSYSRAEHLYRHQLNRKLYKNKNIPWLAKSSNSQRALQTTRSRSTIVNSQDVIGTLSDRTCAPVTWSGIRKKVPNYSGRTPSYITSTPLPRHGPLPSSRRTPVSSVGRP